MTENPSINLSQSVSTSLDQFQKEINYYDQLHEEKYRDQGQTREEHIETLAHNLASDSSHYNKIYNALKFNRFLPAGRIQAALGATEREVSPFNCSVSQPIEDSMDSIMAALSNAAKILRLGTGIGYNFSRLRPQGAEIKKLKTKSSGPLSFMEIFDAMASTIASSGHRRGAQMGIMNVDHPDIEAFIDAKMQKSNYRQFNLSVGVSDAFMHSVRTDSNWQLSHGGTVYKELPAKALWSKIIRNAYESAEPGLIFIDRLNDKNNLYYCEEIEATNPCAEQPLPPYGLCTLGSFNLVAYLARTNDNKVYFNKEEYIKDIHTIVEAYDNIFDDAVYAIPEHEKEARNKRRIGLGLTGIANAIEFLNGYASYGNFDFCTKLDKICEILKVESYKASSELAKKRGSFPLFDREKYLQADFIRQLPYDVQANINENGIRNSHLISYAPCGTISQVAGNTSSGVEPVFHYTMSRDVYMKEGKVNVTLQDFMYRHNKFEGRTLEECTVEDHLKVAETIQKHCDSSISKTVNVSSNCSFDEYQQIYIKAFELGLKGITVYRPSEVRGIVINKAKQPMQETNYVSENSEAHGFPMLGASCANGMCTL